MATIKFLLQSHKNPANIYLRLSVGRGKVLKRKTGFIINPKEWSAKTSLPKQLAELFELTESLKKLELEVKRRFNEAVTNGEEITGDWLQAQIDAKQGVKKQTDGDQLLNYIQAYIDNLPYKDYGNLKQTAKATVRKYTTIRNKLSAFEDYSKQKYYLKDVNPAFRDELLKYFIEVDKLANNTAGRYIKFLKSICLDAGRKGYDVSPHLSDVKGFTVKASKVYLAFEELEKIESTSLSRTALENAKDWLIIGCYIGQRVSDLLILTKDNISTRGGYEMIELVQKKTGKRVSIPIHEKVRAILDKRDGEFPSRISDQKFNLHIKDICEIAGIKEPTKGAKLVSIGEGENVKWRKEYGIFPKYELVSSHVCRRSFATNFYGELPTALLIGITAHSTEQQFLEYIGKGSMDYAVQIAEYWSKQALINKQEPVLNVVQRRAKQA